MSKAAQKPDVAPELDTTVEAKGPNLILLYSLLALALMAALAFAAMIIWPFYLRR